MTITSNQQDAFIRRLAAAASYFCCLIAFYIDIGQDMGAKYFMPILVPIIAALILTQYATRVSIFSRAALPNLLTSLDLQHRLVSVKNLFRLRCGNRCFCAHDEH